MATDIYVVTANGANIGVWNPGAPPAPSLRPISHAHVIIHYAPLIQMMTVVVAIIATPAPHAALFGVVAWKGCFQASAEV